MGFDTLIEFHFGVAFILQFWELGSENPQAQIVQGHIQVDYSTGMRSLSSHNHIADNLLP